MKKVFLFSLLAFMSFSLMFTSCEKDDVEVGEIPEATIIGKVKAELDITNSSMEQAPTGTKLYFRINSQQLVMNPLPNYNYQTLQYETTVGANGEFTMTLPCATHQGVTVTIVPVNFRANVTTNTDPIDYYFTGAQAQVTIRDGEMHYQDLTFN